MKRIACLLAVLALLLPAARSEEALTPIYRATAGLEFHMRPEPESERYGALVPLNVFVLVYQYNDDWCQVGYRDQVGWAKTKWLWGFLSLDAMNYGPVGYQGNVGMLTLEQEAKIVGGEFPGLTAPAGTMVGVCAQTGSGYTLPVWRGETTLEKAAGSFTPFAPWQDAQPGDLIAGYTTYYNRRTGNELAPQRAYNIEFACAILHDMVMQPGDSFDFNALCGPYRGSRGYKIAPNISAEGKGYGGGVCQLTTTLYNAVLGVPLQITDWEVHRKNGVRYIPIYFDACVGSYSNFCFTNTLPYPIRLWAQAQSGALTVMIFRAEET